MKLMDKSLEILGWIIFVLYICIYRAIREIVFEGQNVYSNAAIVYENIIEVLPLIGVSIIFAIIYFIVVDRKKRVLRSIHAIAFVIVQLFLIRSLTGAVALEGMYLRNRDEELVKLCGNIEALVMIFTIVSLVTILAALILIMAVKTNRLTRVDEKASQIQMNKGLAAVIIGLNVILSILMTDLILNGYGEYVGFEALMLPTTMLAAVILPIMIFMVFLVNSFVLKGKVKCTIIGYFLYMLLVKGGMEMVHRSASMYYSKKEIWDYNNGITTNIPLFGRLDTHILLVYIVMGIYVVALAWNGENAFFRSKKAEQNTLFG